MTAVLQGVAPADVLARARERFSSLAERSGAHLIVDAVGTWPTRSDTHIKTLLEQLGDDAERPRWIETLRGVGYRFRDPTDPGVAAARS